MKATVKRAVEGIDGRVATDGLGRLGSARGARPLGISRISVGPYAQALAMAHLREAAAGLTALGAYPKELGFQA